MMAHSFRPRRIKRLRTNSDSELDWEAYSISTKKTRVDTSRTVDSLVPVYPATAPIPIPTTSIPTTSIPTSMAMESDTDTDIGIGSNGCEMSMSEPPLSRSSHSSINLSSSVQSSGISFSDPSGVLKSIVISTKASSPPTTAYQNMNELLHTVHVRRFGDPETRERWWEKSREETMEETAYSPMNAVLRLAFLERHGWPPC
ncbi:hypothetical protein BDF14DRAFT_1808239 [Spinellus fusiger]|nr:hypothetical protein BDF14DRAFT_1808239 [Spinellus fusiger]